MTRRPRQKLRSRFRGTLLGAAVADALSFPYCGRSREFLEPLAASLTDGYVRHRGGHYPLGQCTERTQGAAAVARALLESRGVEARCVADHLIPLWRDLTVVDADPASSEAMRRLASGERDWWRSGLESGRAEAGPLTRAIPVGLWDLRQRDRLPGDVQAVVEITHTDPRVLGASAAVAQAVAHNLQVRDLILGDFLDQVSAAAGYFHGGLARAVLEFPRFLSQTDRRALELMSLELEDDAYPAGPSGLPNYAVPALLAAIYYFLKSPHDYPRVVSRCLRLGGAMGPAAAVAGALVGSLCGEEAVPGGLAADLPQGEDIRRLADDIYEACRARDELPAAAEAPAGEGAEDGLGGPP